MNQKLKIICSKCHNTPIISLNNNLFQIKCIIHGLDKCENINHFLEEENKIEKKDNQCYIHNKEFCWFCKKCAKNICIQCYQDHKNHNKQIVSFPEEMKFKNELDELGKKLKRMKKEEENFNNYTLKFKKLKELIDNLHNLVNEIYEKMSLFNNLFKSQYLFNEAVLNSYDLNALNYNSIININKFKYDNNEIINFRKENNMDEKIKNFNELLRDINLISRDNYIHTFIIPQTDIVLKDTLNEILEFQIKSLKTVCEDKTNLKMDIIGEEFEVKNSIEKKKLSFEFKNKEDQNNILGGISYNIERKALTFYILGDLENGNFLFQCCSDSKSKSASFMLGNFIWLLRLSALTIDKKIIIKKSNKIYRFKVKEDGQLKLKNKNASCIYMKEEIDLNYKDNNLDKYIYIVLSEITPDEWYESSIKIKEIINKIYN